MESNQTKKYSRVLTATELRRRAEIIYYGAKVVVYTDGYAHFSEMKPETARRLISEGFANPEDSQNGAPTFEQMTAFCESHPGFVLEGYVIGAYREDARVTADAIKGPAADESALRAFTNRFRPADEFYCDEHSDECYCWYD